MKGYFSQLALSTGLTLGRNSTSNSSAARAGDAEPGGPQKTAPMHVDAVTFTTPSQTPASVPFEETPDAKALSPAGPASLISPDIPAVDVSVDGSVSAANSVGKSQSDVIDNKPESTNVPVSLSELNRQVSFAEVQTRFIDPETTSGEFQSSSPQERSPTGAQRIIQSSGEPSLPAPLIQFSEGPALEQPNPNPDSVSRAMPDTVIELSSQTTAEEPRVRFIYSDSRASLSETNSAAELLPERAAERESRTIEFSAERSPLRPALSGLLESVETFESQPAGPANAPPALTVQSHLAPHLHQPTPRSEAAQEPVRLLEGSQRAELNRDQQSQRELIVRNYMKEVRAWVAAPPAIDETAPESVEWSEAPPARRDVFVFEHEQERDMTAFPLHNRATEPQVQDVSLSIGNISIVIEEPTSNAPAPVATPPSSARSPELTGSEPKSLSRHYLSPW